MYLQIHQISLTIYEFVIATNLVTRPMLRGQCHGNKLRFNFSGNRFFDRKDDLLEAIKP